MSRCRSCGAAIIWASTAAGRPMPVDADPHPDGTVLLTLDELDLSVHAAVTTSEDPAERRHRSHFATCPNADTWRKR